MELMDFGLFIGAGSLLIIIIMYYFIKELNN